MVARRLHRLWPALLGQAWEYGLDGNLPASMSAIQVGNIAGTASFGAGLWLLQLPKGNDGTVALTETALPNSQTLHVPCSHTGLLYDKATAGQVGHFLQHGRFKPTPGGRTE